MITSFDSLYAGHPTWTMVQNVGYAGMPANDRWSCLPSRV